MSHKENIALFGPLIVLLIVTAAIEIRTGLIRNVVVLPGAVYFVSAGILFGRKPWWHYPAGLVAVLSILYFAATFYYDLTGDVIVGGGCIKLSAAVGAALGISLGIKFAALVLLEIFAVFFAQSEVPSSPIILANVLLLLAYQYRSESKS